MFKRKATEIEQESNSKKVKTTIEEKSDEAIMFENTNLLSLNAPTIPIYARKVAKVLWSDPDSLWERRIVDIEDQKINKPSNARPPFTGPDNMMKIQLLMDSVKAKFNVSSENWPLTWYIVKTSVNQIGQRRRGYKRNIPKGEIDIFTLSAAHRLREAKRQEDLFESIWSWP